MFTLLVLEKKDEGISINVRDYGATKMYTPCLNVGIGAINVINGVKLHIPSDTGLKIAEKYNEISNNQTT